MAPYISDPNCYGSEFDDMKHRIYEVIASVEQITLQGVGQVPRSNIIRRSMSSQLY